MAHVDDCCRGVVASVSVATSVFDLDLQTWIHHLNILVFRNCQMRQCHANVNCLNISDFFYLQHMLWDLLRFSFAWYKTEHVVPVFFIKCYSSRSWWLDMEQNSNALTFTIITTLCLVIKWSTARAWQTKFVAWKNFLPPELLPTCFLFSILDSRLWSMRRVFVENRAKLVCTTNAM